MSEQKQRQEVGFSSLSDLLKVFQPTTRTELRYEPPQCKLDLQLKTLPIRVNALNSPCNTIEEGIPEFSNTLQVSKCARDIVVETRSFKGIIPDGNKREKIIDYLRLLLKVLGLIKKIAGFVNSIAPNPITKNVLIVVGTAHTILTTIISIYDIINGNGDVLDAILDIVASVAELLPLTSASNARDIKHTIQSGCHAVSSIRRAVQPKKNNPNTIDMIHKLGDIERSFLDCQAFANSFYKNEATN